MLRDILKRKDASLAESVAHITQVAPDILVLTDFDYDLGLHALSALGDLLAEQGLSYPYVFSRRPNTGWQTGIDINGDGDAGGPRDAQGYGTFSGQGGMAVLSNRQVHFDTTQDLSELLWRDLPENLLLDSDVEILSQDAIDIQRLSSAGHWIVPIQINPSQTLDLMVFHATPPVFDGPEDRNGRRNHDESALWLRVLDDDMPKAKIGTFPVLIGNANLDIKRGEGRKEALARLLSHPKLQDPKPTHQGLDTTVDWPEPVPGDMRVSYVLPSRDLQVTAAGVHWPTSSDSTLNAHRLVWVDVTLPQ